MRINGTAYRTIWPAADGRGVEIIDQTRLPHDFVTVTLRSLTDAATAIRDMWVRGAPLIGATAAYGMALAANADAGDAALAAAYQTLHATRPTAINLKWALDEMMACLKPLAVSARVEAAYGRAAAICDEDAAMNAALGEHGAAIIADLHRRKGERINLLTHCNAGWLATVDWGTALAPVYKAVEAGIPIHVWVDETRPRNQGASLTARELNWHGVPHTVIADNTGGHLMQHGLVDLCIVGTDRTTRNGDVCNKIGTYLKALAAYDNGVPFYVGLPSPTIDWTVADGVREIPIEQRSPREQSHIFGKGPDGTVVEVQVIPDGSQAVNYGFDVTPARLITGLITERGVCAASPEGLKRMFPDRG